MKQVTVNIPDDLEYKLVQFLHTDNRATYKPIYLVQNKSEYDPLCLGEDAPYKTVAYFFSEEEAKRYCEYQAHNLTKPRTFAAGPGYSNKGDWEPFYDLLKVIAKECEK